MSCTTCGRNKVDGYKQPMILQFPPYGAKDMIVLKNKNKQKLENGHWNKDTHKLLIFTENIDEINAKDYDNLLEDYNIQSYAISVYNDKEIESDEIIRATSYILPARLSILHNGELKKSIVFVKNDSSIIIHDYFENMNFDIVSFIKNIKHYIGGESVNITQE